MNQNILHTNALIETIKGKLVAVASEEVEDRHGEVISIDGWNLKNFKKNPQLLWMHNLTHGRSLPIGRAEKIGIRTIDGVKKLVFEPVFEEITEFGRTVKRFVEEGWLNTFSVGMLPLEKEDNRYLKQELLEVSLVPVPALASAEIISRSKAMSLDEGIVKGILGEEELDVEELDTEDKGAVGYSAAPPASEGQAWDAFRARKRMANWAGGLSKDSISWSKYRRGFAWHDEDDPKSFSAYKLPHHDVIDGQLKTVWRGVAAAMAALLGARGGTNVGGNKRAVYNHLKRHYGQFDKEAPDFKHVEAETLRGFSDEIDAISDLRAEVVVDERRIIEAVKREAVKARTQKQISKDSFGVEDLRDSLRILDTAVSIVLSKLKRREVTKNT